MKIFWAVLLVLILGSVAYMTLGRSGSASRAKETVAPPMEAARRVATPTSGAPAAVRADNDESAFFPERAAEPTPEPKGPEVVVIPDAAPMEPEAVAPVEVKAEAPLVEKEEIAASPLPAPTPAPTPAPVPAPATTAPTAPAADAGGGVVFGADAKVVTQDDGSMMVDDKYALKGEGTKAKPYEITWEYLISAQEDYQPRLGKKKLPGRLKLINDKHVKITGFVAFPIMATEPTEMLAMLNQWDGCCIGIPPTPYDAVEVRLSEPASNEQRLVTFGSVEGKLTVEPYLVRDWLVSLYSLEEASLSRAQ